MLSQSLRLSGIQQTEAQQRSTISTENKMKVLIHNLSEDGSFDKIAEISPPYLKHVSLVKFSPSGKLLLIGNEAGQYFYVYDL